MIACPTGCLSLPTRTPPCICPEKPIAWIGTSPARLSACPTALIVACHQSSGFCSAHPGCGTLMGYSCPPLPRIRVCSSITTALTLDVPRSMPNSANGGYFLAGKKDAERLIIESVCGLSYCELHIGL